ncbi:serine protease inhibitor dipetalogastin [Magallana gigas]
MITVVLLAVISSIFSITLSTSEPCSCPDKDEPVCGENGFNYTNACFMKCDGVAAAQDPMLCCTCDLTYNPVCGTNGKSYGNRCMASCVGVRMNHEGECLRYTTVSPCPDVYEPVCGADGMTYYNPCKAVQAKARIISNGECPRNCVCPDHYRPVCGSDGVTYPNRCVAGCINGIYDFQVGECQEGGEEKAKGTHSNSLLDQILNSLPIDIIRS